LVATVSDRFRGLILGAAVGDALGLPAEGVSRRRLQRLYRGHWRHRFVWGRGMVSDDTEHVFFVAQSLLAQPTSAEAFARRLGWSLRGWLLTLPAGIGWGTLRAIVRLWLGVPADRSGVHSAGNGPAMRVAPIGAFFAGRAAQLEAYVRSSTRLTHRDERAEVAALAVARLVSWSIEEALAERPPLERFLEVLRYSGDAEWRARVVQLGEAAQRGASVREFAAQLGCERGVSGYSYHTVPVAAYAWFRHFGDFRASLVSVLDCGGDTDTTGAIVGALAGSAVGESGIPETWIEGIAERPRGTALLRELADRLAAAAAGEHRSPVHYFWPAVIPRNLAFFLLVLAHGLRRLAPPY
jgi:ADP-ribosyl-[dinitrogen reductase] hydrolase